MTREPIDNERLVKIKACRKAGAAMAEDFVTRGSLLTDEWAREVSRKDSLEKRGITVITTSGALVTLIFAFTSAVAKGHNLGNFTLGEKIAIAVALKVSASNSSS